MHRSRLTIASREAKKKQAVHNEQVSYLQVATTLKVVNALNKSPQKLSLSYQGLRGVPIYRIGKILAADMAKFAISKIGTF